MTIHVDDDVLNADWPKVLVFLEEQLAHEMSVVQKDKVRTPAGSDKYDQPIGTTIIPGGRKKPSRVAGNFDSPLPSQVLSRDKSTVYQKVERADAKTYRAIVKIAKAKCESVPQPTDAEIASNHARMQRRLETGQGRQGGERGNSKDRARSRKALFTEFGGHERGWVPCVYCGLKLHHDNSQREFPVMERDKILTENEGGRYKNNNLLPSCASCNSSRGEEEVIFGVPTWKRK